MTVQKGIQGLDQIGRHILKEFSKTVDLSSTLRYHSLEMKGAKRGGSAERKNDSDDEETGPMDATKSQKRTGKPLPPLFPVCCHIFIANVCQTTLKSCFLC